MKNKKKYIKVEESKYRRMARDRERILKIKSYVRLIRQILDRLK